VSLTSDGTQATGSLTVHRTLTGSSVTHKCGVTGPCEITVVQFWSDGTLHTAVNEVEIGFYGSK
jgi:hypothetical protein